MMRSTRRPAILPASFVACRCVRSEEHTSELQSRSDLVCRLLLEKKKIVRLKRNVPPVAAITASLSVAGVYTLAASAGANTTAVDCLHLVVVLPAPEPHCHSHAHS